MTSDDKAVNTPEELIRLQCECFRKLNAILSDDTAQNIGRRLELLSQSAMLPQSGFGDVRCLAALLNLDVRSIQRQLERAKPQGRGYGRSVLYSLADWLIGRKGVGE